MRRAYILLAAVTTVLIGGLLSGCGGDGEDTPPPTSSRTPAATATSAATIVATQPAPTATAAPASTTSAEPSPAPTTPPTQPVPSATPAEPPEGAAEVLARGTASGNFIALTFDAGSDAGFTTQILDTLQAEGITASFGITGRWAEQNPALLQRIVGDGHELINHSYDHDSFTGHSTGNPPQTREQRWLQLDRTADIVRELSGADVRPYFRPPYGDWDASVNEDIFARGYTYNVMWTVDSLGWNGLAEDEIIARCLDLAVPGAVYIFHVGSASQDGPALPAIVNGLRAQGYALGSVTELLSQ